MKDIKILANQFRNAIDAAKAAGCFDKDLIFKRFPCGCCGDASDLLAQFLLENGIKTYYVCGTYRDEVYENIQSHAWLVTEDNTMIDITGDQFKNHSDFLNYDKAIYVGSKDDFHKLFEVEDRDIRNAGFICLGRMCLPRLVGLYGEIIKYV